MGSVLVFREAFDALYPVLPTLQHPVECVPRNARNGASDNAYPEISVCEEVRALQSVQHHVHWVNGVLPGVNREAIYALYPVVPIWKPAAVCVPRYARNGASDNACPQISVCEEVRALQSVQHHVHWVNGARPGVNQEDLHALYSVVVIGQPAAWCVPRYARNGASDNVYP